MTRLFLAGMGCGATLTIWVVALRGRLACASLSFVGGMTFLAAVIIGALLLVRWIGLKMGWLQVFHGEHSQPLDQPKDTSPY